MAFEVQAISERLCCKGDYVERSTPALIHLKTFGANN